MKMILCFLLLILAATTVSSQNNIKCPFQYIYHFGDGLTDIGNSIHVLSGSTDVPSKHSPYGVTYPGWPTGRWSDGLVDFDYIAPRFGLPNVVPYLTLRNSTTYDGVVFSVATSPVLPRSFFESKGITIPPYAVPLDDQMTWFKKYLTSVCSTAAECADWLANSFILMGDFEGNDIGYALTQGKSIQEVQTYVPIIIKNYIDVSGELIKLGATRVLIPGNGPIGCFPYILTALHTTDPTAYDEIGCLKSVNDLVVSKNNDLQRAIDNLRTEFPNTNIYYSETFDGVYSVINETSVIGADGENMALKACCGIGGKYNYDGKRFCGSSGVPVCSNPNEYLYWDGKHFTQNSFYQWEHVLVKPFLESLNCTTDVETGDLPGITMHEKNALFLIPKK